MTSTAEATFSSDLKPFSSSLVAPCKNQVPFFVFVVRVLFFFDNRLAGKVSGEKCPSKYLPICLQIVFKDGFQKAV